jgi:proline iminopeptidase
MERLRAEVAGVEAWTVFGGSWGSTLALAYAESHPERVEALVLRGIFMLRRAELLWFYQEGASHLFPDAFEKYLEAIPAVERGDLMSAYYRRLTDGDEDVRLAAAKAWSVWEATTSLLYPSQKKIDDAAGDRFAEAFARIECHYFVHGGFFEVEDQLLRDAHRIAHIPCEIVQGRYDVVCPARSAWDLHKALPNATLTIVEDAGHSAFEPGIAAELVRATNALIGK